MSLRAGHMGSFALVTYLAFDYMTLHPQIIYLRLGEQPYVKQGWAS